MLPRTLALIDGDRKNLEALSQYLREKGVAVATFAGSNELLAHADPYGYDFYVVGLDPLASDGLNLTEALRLRSNVGILVVVGELESGVLASVISAGADMFLSKPVQFEEVAITIKAVHRRADAASANHPAWRLDRRARQLTAPDGAKVDLSQLDLAVVECFVRAKGEVVTRASLHDHLGQGAGRNAADGLTATIYRLRRRIEEATPMRMPLRAKPRVGYVFRASLQAA